VYYFSTEPSPEGLHQGILRLCRGLDIVKIDKSPLVIVSHISIGERGALFGGIIPPTPTVAMGLLQ